MPKRNKKKRVNEKTLRSIKISDLQKQLNSLQKQGKEEYHPKIGRQIKQIKKKIDQAS